jgi:hypothetical protein
MSLEELQLTTSSKFTNEPSSDRSEISQVVPIDLEPVYDGRDGDELAHACQLTDDTVITSLVKEDSIIRLLFDLSLGPFLGLIAPVPSLRPSSVRLP